MKNALGITVIVLSAGLVTGLSACGKSDPPRPEPRVESASDALRADSKAIAEKLSAQMAASEKSGQVERAEDERKQMVESLYAIARKWDGAVDAASKINRAKLDDSIKAMQAIKVEAEALATNDCTAKARAFLLDSMSASFQAFEQFRKETGDPSESTKQKNKEASNLLAESSAALATCK